MSDAATNKALADLLQLMACLRHPQFGCPWDLQQNFSSIAPYTVEEVYEVVDAIERNDQKQLRDELGDLLFQIVFYAQLGKELQLYDFAAIAQGITEKLLRRHPHVFPEATLASFGQPPTLLAEGVVTKWEAIKAEERQQKTPAAQASVLDDVPLALPALQRATKLQKRAATQGFDWSHASEVFTKLEEELTELKVALQQQDASAISDEFGDVLFTMVNLSRHLQVNAEQSLRGANQKFERRFRELERLVTAAGQRVSELSLEQLERYWQQVKASEFPLA